jgi:predicted MFS family arabinose efflux permease
LFLLTINRGHSWGWTSPAILIFGVVSLMSLWLFIRTERVAEAPLMPLHWLRTPNIILPIAIQALINFAYMGGFIVVPQMLERGLGYSASHVGWLIIARPLTFSITAPLASFFTMRAGERKSGVIGACAVIASMLILSSLASGSSDLLVVLGLGLSGIGFGIAAPALTALVANAVDDETIGVAGAMQQLLSQMGAVLGSTVMISVHEMTVGSTTVVRSYGIALLFGAGTATVAALLATRLTPTDRSADALANT